MAEERQEHDDSGMWDRPVQAARFTESRGKNGTELARHHGWRFNGEDALTENRGPVIAWTIEDAAFAMESLGWIPIQGIRWGRSEQDRGCRCRPAALFDANGRFPGRPVR